MKLSKNQRATVKMLFGGKCAYCGCDLQNGRWHGDHIEPVQRSGTKLGKPHHDHFANIWPACTPCNIHKSDFTLEGWRKYLERQVEMARAYSAPFRHAERFGMVIVQKTKVVFYFETLGVIAPKREIRDEDRKIVDNHVPEHARIELARLQRIRQIRGEVVEGTPGG